MRLGNAMCNYSGSIMEDTFHVLRDCPLMMSIWLSIMDMNLCVSLFAGNLDQWISVNMKINLRRSIRGEWKVFWALGCHIIRGQRNRELHEENYVRPTHLVNFVAKLTHDYTNVMHVSNMIVDVQREIQFIKWEPPPLGQVKLNMELVRKMRELGMMILRKETMESGYVVVLKILEFVVLMWLSSVECTKVWWWLEVWG